MQKHLNVLQYRASMKYSIKKLFPFYFSSNLGYCTEQSDFYSNCINLSPESELVTIYRGY